MPATPPIRFDPDQLRTRLATAPNGTWEAYGAQYGVHPELSSDALDCEFVVVLNEFLGQVGLTFDPTIARVWLAISCDMSDPVPTYASGGAWVMVSLVDEPFALASRHFHATELADPDRLGLDAVLAALGVIVTTANEMIAAYRVSVDGAVRSHE